MTVTTAIHTQDEPKPIAVFVHTPTPEPARPQGKPPEAKVVAEPIPLKPE